MKRAAFEPTKSMDVAAKLIAIVLLLGCNSGAGGGPMGALAADLVVRNVCGAAFQDELESERDIGDGTFSVTSGCDMVRKGASSTGAKLIRRGSTVESVEIEVWGYAEDQATLQTRVLDAAAPLLDEVRRREARAAIERVHSVVLRFVGPGSSSTRPGGEAIRGATMVLKPDNPWERFVVLQLAYRIVEPTTPAVPREEPVGFAPLDLAAWETACRDDAILEALLGEPVQPAPSEPYTGGVPWHDRWATGDRWMRCQATAASGGHFAALASWNPDTRRLIRFRIDVKGLPIEAIVRVVDRLLAPVLAPAEREAVLEAARDTAYPRDEGDLDITSQHDGDTHELIVESHLR